MIEPGRQGEWPKFVANLLNALDMNMSDLARLVGDKPQNLRSRIMDPEGRAPKGADLTRWARALKLEGELKQKFMLLSDLDRAPAFLRARLVQLDERLKRAEDALKREKESVRELSRRAADLERQLGEATAKLSEFLGTGA